MSSYTTDLELVSALERGFRLLHCLADAGRPLTNGELAKTTGIPAATASRLVSTLVALGHVRPSREAGAYELAAGVVGLAQSFLGSVDVRKFARPHLATLAERSGASAFVGIRDGDDVLVVEGARSRSATIRISADVGTRMSLRTSALGRAWWAGTSAGVRASIWTQWSGVLSPQELEIVRKAYTDTVARGYAISVGEWHAAINAIAIPIRTASGEVFSLNCGSPAFDMSPGRLTRVVAPLLREAARSIAVDIGGTWGSELIHSEAEAAMSDGKPKAQSRRTKSKETT